MREIGVPNDMDAHGQDAVFSHEALVRFPRPLAQGHSAAAPQVLPAEIFGQIVTVVGRLDEDATPDQGLARIAALLGTIPGIGAAEFQLVPVPDLRVERQSDERTALPSD